MVLLLGISFLKIAQHIEKAVRFRNSVLEIRQNSRWSSCSADLPNSGLHFDLPRLHCLWHPPVAHLSEGRHAELHPQGVDGVLGGFSIHLARTLESNMMKDEDDAHFD